MFCLCFSFVVDCCPLLFVCCCLLVSFAVYGSLACLCCSSCFLILVYLFCFVVGCLFVRLCACLFVCLFVVVVCVCMFVGSGFCPLSVDCLCACCGWLFDSLFVLWIVVGLPFDVSGVVWTLLIVECWL